jgi:hypothetical protein
LRRTNTIGHLGGCAFKRQCAELPPFPYFAVECRVLRSPVAAVRYDSGSRARDNCGPIRRARWANHPLAHRHLSDRPKTAWIRGRKSRHTSPRRHDRPALGEAGGDARSPSPARQGGLGLCVPGGWSRGRNLRVADCPETRGRGMILKATYAQT